MLEVTNTPWQETVHYVLHPGAQGVECFADREPKSHSDSSTRGSSTDQLINGDGSEGVSDSESESLDWAKRSAGFDEPEIWSRIGDAGALRNSLSRGARRLRFRWAKGLHVSPFFGMDHEYDWIFAMPPCASHDSASGSIPFSSFHVWGRNTRPKHAVL